MRATVFLSVVFSTAALAGVIQPRQDDGPADNGDGQPTSQNAAGGGGGGTFQFAAACKAPGSATPNPEDPMAKAFTAYHNVHRTYQGACSLLWDPALAKQAQAAANTCKFQHQMIGNNGQNVAEGSASGNIAGSTVSMWYEEGSKTNYQGGNMQQGHYTQVLWKSTSAVGCGFKNCGGMTLVFCDYAPAGNMMGAFKQNVGKRVAGARPICAEQQAMSQYAGSGGGQGGSGGAGGKCITDEELGLPAGAGGGGSQGAGGPGGGTGLKLGKGGLKGNSMGGGGGASPLAQLMKGGGGG